MISKSFFKFLKDLSKNNNKEWFDENRKTYESEVKKPFEEFVVELGNSLHKFDEDIAGDYKKGIFRINRDIRFSKDKTPYKTNRSAAFSLNSKKDHASPGYYIELGATKSYIAGGSWCPSNDNLRKIRSEIYYNLDEFNKIIKNKNFKSSFEDVKGDKAKRLPKDVAEWALESEYIYNKQFYFWKEFDSKIALEPNFIKELTMQFKNGYDLNQFLRRAMRD